MMLLNVTREICKPVNKEVLHRGKEQLSDNSPGIRVSCSTRWTAKAQALHNILNKYHDSCSKCYATTLQFLWEESLDHIKDQEMKCRIRGVALYMETFDFLFSVILRELLLYHSKLWEQKTILDTFGSRPQECWFECERASLLRKRKRPAKFEIGNACAYFPQLCNNTITRYTTKHHLLHSTMIRSTWLSSVFQVTKSTTEVCWWQMLWR